MRVAAPLVLVLIFLGVDAGTLARDADGAIYPQRSIARVKLGMSKAQVKARLGRPALKVQKDSYMTFYYSRVAVTFLRGGGVVKVETTRSTERTRSGVGIGSTEKKVRRGVRGVVCGPYVTVMRLCRVGSGAAATKVTDFLLYGGRVRRVTLAKITANPNGRDTSPPTRPANLTVLGTTKTTISVSWDASKDDVGVLAYFVYRNGLLAGGTTKTRRTFSGLACAAPYLIEVEAIDRAGNRSPRARLSVVTADCPASGDVHISPTGSDSNPCTSQAPCRSFDRAYRVAEPGQLVDVWPGVYSGQTINRDRAKTSLDDVVFRAPIGGIVSLEGSLHVYGSHIEFRNFAAFLWYAHPGATDVTFSNLDVGKFFITGASDVAVIGGDVGPLNNSDSQVKSGEGIVPTNIVIDGVFFHDALKTDPKAHTECLQFGSGINVVIRNSVFTRCSDHDIFIRSWGSINGNSHPLENFIIENNVLDQPLRGYYTMQIAFKTGWPCGPFLVRNNSSYGRNMVSSCQPTSNGAIRFYGNIQPSKRTDQCGSAIWDWNVYEEGVPCGKHDRVAPMGYRDPQNLDFRLLPGAAGIGNGNPTSHPSADIDGVRRPQGGAPDAGAYEAP